MTYAARTAVSVEKSKREIEATLARYGADKFFTGWDADMAVVGFRMSDRFVQFKLPLPNWEAVVAQRARSRGGKTAAQAAFEQELRTRWRALLLCIKAKLQSVESGIEDFEEAFLAHIMVKDASGADTTVGEVLIPQIELSYSGGSPRLALPAST